MKEQLEKFMDWLWINHNILTDANKNKIALEQYLTSEQGKQALSLFSVKHRLCINCKHCLPNDYAKYHHDRYFCTVDKNNDKVTITSPEHYNCNRHDFNGA